MKTAIYVRVSTEVQSLEPQRKELRVWCERNGVGEGEVVEYSDVMSGTKCGRAGLEAMIEAAEGGEVGMIVTVKLDRLARSMINFVELVGKLERCGCALVVPGQSIDTRASSPCGRFQMQVLAAVAQLERDFISERTKAGLAVVKARGVKLGHPSKLLVGDWRERVAAWKEKTGGVDFKMLAGQLGGVSASTAWRKAKEVGAI